MPQPLNVLYLVPLRDEDRRRVAQELPGTDITFADLSEFTPEQAKDAQIVFGNVPVARLGEFPQLKWMHLFTAGYDQYVGQLPPGVTLTYSSGVFNEAIAEYILANVFVHMLHFPALMQLQREHAWKDAGKAGMMLGSTVLVVGAGNIGATFARKAKLLGARRVIGIRRNTAQKPEGIDEVHPLEALPELLPQADVVVTVLSSSPQTSKVFNREMFARFKPGAIFVNAGRGTLVDTDALLEALQNKTLAGATIDVTDPEPLPPDHPAWEVENLVITAHIAAGFKVTHKHPIESCYTLQQMVGLFRENMACYRDGKPLKNVAIQG